MYNQKPANIYELKTYIQRAIEEIKQEELFNSIENIKDRIGLCTLMNGGHFEQFD